MKGLGREKMSGKRARGGSDCEGVRNERRKRKREGEREEEEERHMTSAKIVSLKTL